MRTLIKKTTIVAATGLTAFAVLALPYSSAYADWGPEEVIVSANIDSSISIGGGSDVSDVTVDGTPVGGTGVGGGNDTNSIVVSTNNPTGYTLRLSMATASTDRNLNLGGTAGASNNIAGAATGSFAALGDNTWGYNTDGSANFAGVPLSAAPATIKSSAGAISNDTTGVTYGIKTTSALPEGTYSNTVQYTAVVNP